VVVSQNSYPANDRSVIASFAVPGGKVALRRGPVGELLAAFARRWHTEVEPLAWPGCWGYAERPIRGSTTVLSNHASGTAIDLNAPKHPLAADPAASLKPAQIAAVRKIIAESDGCLRWGGDYTGRRDGMHTEAIKGEAACAAVLARWNGATPTEDDMPLTDADVERIAQRAAEIVHTRAMVSKNDPRGGWGLDDRVTSIDATIAKIAAKLGI
jgi:D-alanyl-D-alanine carboxypeptidase